MAKVEIRVSDLTREPLEDRAARLIVEHPDYPDPIGLDVMPSEIEGHLTEDRSRFVVVSLDDPENPTPERYVLLLEEFENLFHNGDSQTALQEAYTTQQEAQRTRSRGGRRRAAGGRRQQQDTRRRERIDYSSPDHAGEPHPGRITDAEKEYVRDHLDEVNARLRQQGRREIDPTDPQMAERYGLEQRTEEAEVIEETPPPER